MSFLTVTGGMKHDCQPPRLFDPPGAKTIRSLRRTLIVHLLQRKMDIHFIVDWQGHADADLILKRYGKHLDEDYKKQALASLRASA